MSFKRDRDLGNKAQESSSGSMLSSEQVEITSGCVVFLDQFMLASKELFSELGTVSIGTSSTSESYSKLNEVVMAYGGSVAQIPNGDYRVLRNPYQSIVVLVPCDGDSKWASLSDQECVSAVSDMHAECVLSGQVFVDTRCFVVFDASLFSKAAILEKYRTLRSTGEDKQARDLLRGCGCAVRYGFQRYGDELGLFKVTDSVLALWPDTVEPMAVRV